MFIFTSIPPALSHWIAITIVLIKLLSAMVLGSMAMIAFFAHRAGSQTAIRSYIHTDGDDLVGE
jgi:hypothetical protein